MGKLVLIVTVSKTASGFLAGQAGYFKSKGYDVTVIASPDRNLTKFGNQEGVAVFGIPMQREISLIQDIVALWRLYRYLRSLHPTIVNASTPKAGLLGMLAARFAGVPIRVYQQRGLRQETTAGVKRWILMATEWLSLRCASVVVCNSTSLLETITSLNLAPRHKLLVLGSGSSNGVNAERFSATPERKAEASQLRRQLGISDQALVLGFVGRLTRDKGISELLDIFEQLQPEFPDLHLVLVGGYEPGDPLSATSIKKIEEHPRIHTVGHVADTAPYYHLMDLFMFLSYREGFPNAPLEAAAAGIPTIGFQATGVVDAVVDGQTGLLAPVGDLSKLQEITARLLREPDERHRMGGQAATRTRREFDQRQVWENWRKFYEECLQKAES